MIRLSCPQCGKTVDTPRDPDTDPPNAVRMEMSCEECGAGGFDLVDYFDAAGEWIDADPAKFAGGL